MIIKGSLYFAENRHSEGGQVVEDFDGKERFGLWIGFESGAEAIADDALERNMAVSIDACSEMEDCGTGDVRRRRK